MNAQEIWDASLAELELIISKAIFNTWFKCTRALEVKGTDLIIISGFTVGTDSHAHELALGAGCSTVAVMPCGCDIVHPSTNKELYKRIVGGGGAVV